MNVYLAPKKSSFYVANLRSRVRFTHHSRRCTECTLRAFTGQRAGRLESKSFRQQSNSSRL